LTPDQARRSGLSLAVKSSRPLAEVTVYCRNRVVFHERVAGDTCRAHVDLANEQLRGFLRAEVHGDACHLVSNPFYLASARH